MTNFLGRVIALSVDVTFPQLFDRSVKDAILNGEGKFAGPGHATKFRGRFHLDVALILAAQSMAMTPMVRIGWADSSLQKSRDWLHASCDEIPLAHVTEVFLAGRSLCDDRFRRERNETPRMDDEQLAAHKVRGFTKGGEP